MPNGRAPAICGSGPAQRSNVYILPCTHVRLAVMDVLSSRVFMNGNSQAVRIPAQRGQALINLLAGFDADFVAALEQL